MSEGLSHNQQGLVDFLRRHSHIKELTFQRLDAFKQDEALVNDTWNASSKATLHWDHLTLSDIGSITMPNLRRLTLNINRFHGDDAVFKNISQFIQQSSSQLEFFSCEGAYLHHDEILVLVKALGVTAALPTMLRELHICTKTITGVLLTQLHEICSHLESLAIRMTAADNISQVPDDTSRASDEISQVSNTNTLAKVDSSESNPNAKKSSGKRWYKFTNIRRALKGKSKAATRPVKPQVRRPAAALPQARQIRAYSGDSAWNFYF